MTFWIAAGVVSLLVALIILMTYLRPGKTEAPAAAYDLKVYRDQLKEVERDLERGVLTEEEAARARTEVSRRILEADRALSRSETASGGGTGGRWMIAASLVLVIGGAVGVYYQLGAPGYPDLPLQARIQMVEEARATRPAQAEAEEDVPFREGVPEQPEREALVVQLRTIMEQRRDDPEGWALLAQNEAALGNFTAAHRAQAQLIALLGDETPAQAHVDLAEMMILAAGGYVSPEAEDALLRALEMNPRNGTARYYAGLMYAQQGRPDLAYPIWRNLLAESRADAPWLGPIRIQIEEIAALAGDPVSLAELPQPDPASAEDDIMPPMRGPSGADMDAAAEMTPEERAEMVEGMVANLSQRLATEGGPPEEWVRLINAYLVLGRPEQAQAIYDEAQTVFAEVPEAMEMLAPLGARLGGADE
ncbi:putative heme lyase subunit CcmH-like protein [Roseibacterium elongatum DSM 19469]|uniref:Putative heme lyase subunit CcmH-like protein n=1 Tax=Roseicyclus elongatus DSM 19469 TaxID=1294273 RepID=W8SRI5_9RHOB|nr:c-type cytochrome biogenesis protein CcmI [Roseibacterium elongatum]AHM05150.1 putative heme lyase subunit CcmH-like protein [Roseibacterium elongatum DSM 19469]